METKMTNAECVMAQGELTNADVQTFLLETVIVMETQTWPRSR
jgi:hypothetical protein